MEQDPAQNDTRRAQRARRLGEQASCILCGETNPDVLRRVGRSLFERHHVAGRANAPDLTVTLCRNCHAKVTAGQRDTGAFQNQPPTFLHRLVAILRSLGVLFKNLSDKCFEWAQQLARLIFGFDSRAPGWQQWPEAV